MIAKTNLGSDFEGALTYGAGLRTGKTKEPKEAPLLVVSNVIPGTPKQMAQEMKVAALQSNKIKKPVWHTVLSWKEGEKVTGQQKVEAVKRYCELMGAPIDKHQVVVYEHKDKKHDHVHIYLNRVPVDGGPALRSDNNFYRQPGVCKRICQELGMEQLPTRRQSIKDVDPIRQETREKVREALTRLVQQGRGGEQWLAEELLKEKIQTRYTHDKGGVLRGVSFELEGVAVKGQEVGYKAAQLRESFTIGQDQKEERKLTEDKKKQAAEERKVAIPRRKRGPSL